MVKLTFLLVPVLLGSGLLSSAVAAEINLSVQPSTSAVPVGGNTTVDLTISGLGNGTAPSLSAFDLSLGFDPMLLSVSKVSFGSSSPPFDQLNLSNYGTISQFIQPSAGILRLYEVSLDDPATLNSMQLGAFTLAEITFNGRMAGSSHLSLSVTSLGDASGNPLFVSSVTGASVSVNGSSVVPEPGSAALFGLAVGLSIIWRIVLRKFRSVD